MILMLRSGQGYYFAAAGPQLADATLLQNVAKYRSWPKIVAVQASRLLAVPFLKRSLP